MEQKLGFRLGLHLDARRGEILHVEVHPGQRIVLLPGDDEGERPGPGQGVRGEGEREGRAAFVVEEHRLLTDLASQGIAGDEEDGERLGGRDVAVAHHGLERGLLTGSVDVPGGEEGRVVTGPQPGASGRVEGFLGEQPPRQANEGDVLAAGDDGQLGGLVLVRAPGLLPLNHEEPVLVGLSLGQDLIGPAVDTHLGALDGLDRGERVGPEQHSVLPDPRHEPQVAQVDDLSLLVPIFPIGVADGEQEQAPFAPADLLQGEGAAHLFIQGKREVELAAVDPFGQIPLE